jgi:hypothetical protein
VKARDEHTGEGNNSRVAASTANDRIGFFETIRLIGPASALAIKLKLVLIHQQTKDALQPDDPAMPRREIAQERLENLRVLDRFDDGRLFFHDNLPTNILRVYKPRLLSRITKSTILSATSNALSALRSGEAAMRLEAIKQMRFSRLMACPCTL